MAVVLFAKSRVRISPDNPMFRSTRQEFRIIKRACKLPAPSHLWCDVALRCGRASDASEEFFRPGWALWKQSEKFQGFAVLPSSKSSCGGLASSGFTLLRRAAQLRRSPRLLSGLVRRNATVKSVSYPQPAEPSCLEMRPLRALFANPRIRTLLLQRTLRGAGLRCRLGRPH